ENASVAEAVQDERRVLVRRRRDQAEHGLVAGREHQALLVAEELGEPPFEVHVLHCGGLDTGARQPTCAFVDRLVRSPFHTRVVRTCLGVVPRKSTAGGAPSSHASAAAIPIAPPAPRVSPRIALGAATGTAVPRSVSIAASSARSNVARPETPLATTSTSLA